MKPPTLLTLPLAKLTPRARDARVKELLTPKAKGNLGSVMIHLDFNARLVTALREQNLWPR